MPIIARLLRKSAWILPAILLAGTSAGYGDEPTTPTRTVLISAQSLLGEPVGGAELNIDTGGKKELIKTNDAGLASIRLPEGMLGKLGIEAAGSEYGLAEVVVATSAGHDRLIYFVEIYPTDPTAMTAEMRQAYVDRLPAILARERATGISIPGDATTPNALRLSALLNVYRGEDEPWGAKGVTPPAEEPAAASGDGKPEAPTPAIAVQVVDSLGHAVARRVVELYELSEKGAKVQVIRRGRTDPAGEIVFRRLETGHFYRLFVPVDGDDLFARSPIVQLSTTTDYKPRPLVIRPRGQTISGLVFFGDRPLPRARVVANGKNMPMLEATTDQFGYFDLGPLPPGPADLAIQHPGTGESVVVHETVGDEEVLVPFDVLRLPVKVEDKSDEPAK